MDICNSHHPTLSVTCQRARHSSGQQCRFQDHTGFVHTWFLRGDVDVDMVQCGHIHPMRDLACDMLPGHGKQHRFTGQSYVYLWSDNGSEQVVSRDHYENEHQESRRQAMENVFGPLSPDRFKRGRQNMNPHDQANRTFQTEKGTMRTHEYKTASLIKILKNFLKRVEDERKQVAKDNAKTNAKVLKALNKAMEDGEYEFSAHGRSETRTTDSRSLGDIASDLAGTLNLHFSPMRARGAEIDDANHLILKFEAVSGDTVELTDAEFEAVSRYERFAN